MTAPTLRPGGRSARVQESIHKAVRELLDVGREPEERARLVRVAGRAARPGRVALLRAEVGARGLGQAAPQRRVSVAALPLLLAGDLIVDEAAAIGHVVSALRDAVLQRWHRNARRAVDVVAGAVAVVHDLSF